MKKHVLTLLALLIYGVFPVGAAEFTVSDDRLPKCLLIVQYTDEKRGLNTGPLSIRALLDDIRKRAPDYGFDRLVTEDDPALKVYLAKKCISLKKLHGQDRWGESVFALLKPFLIENEIPAVMEIHISPDAYRGVQCTLNVYAVVGNWGFLGGFVKGELPEEIVLEDTVDALLEEAADFLNTPLTRKKWQHTFANRQSENQVKPKIIPHPKDKPFPKTAFFLFNGTSPQSSERCLPVDEKDLKTALDTLNAAFEREKMTDLLKCGDPVWNETAKSFGCDPPENLEKQSLTTLNTVGPGGVSMTGFARKANCALYCRVCVFKLYRKPEEVRVTIEIGGIYSVRSYGNVTGSEFSFKSGGKPNRFMLTSAGSWASMLRKMGPAIWDKRISAYTEQTFHHAYTSSFSAPLPPFRETQNKSFAPEPGGEKSVADAVLSDFAALPPEYRLTDAAIGDDGNIYLAVRTKDKHLELWRLDRRTAQLSRVAAAPPDTLCYGSGVFDTRSSRFDVRDGQAVLIYIGRHGEGNAGVFDLKNGSFTPLDFLPAPATGCALMNGKVYLLFARETREEEQNLHLLMACDPNGNGRKIVMNNAAMEKRGFFDRYQYGNLYAITADPPRDRLLVYTSSSVKTFLPKTGEGYGLIDFQGRYAAIRNAGNEVFFCENQPNLTMYKFDLKSGKTDFLFTAQEVDPDKASRVDATVEACENVVVGHKISQQKGPFACVAEGAYLFHTGATVTVLNMRDAACTVRVPALPRNAYYYKMLPAGDGRSVFLIDERCAVRRLAVGPEVKRKGNPVP